MKKVVVTIIFMLITNINVSAQEFNLSTIENKFTSCTNTLETAYNECPETWNTKCYHKLMAANKDTQLCYKQIAIDMFVRFYNLPGKEAEKRFDTFSKSLYEQYLFVLFETNYCQKNNCGIGQYLHSEYATTEQLKYYVNKIINSVSVNINND